ncbi:MAG: tetratricopeptide repeat protein [Lyngbya sp. HA4199-MV5]|nr:tetratricopeptide repeat protein [Lyngbya sp. HA4199-MV5]
MADSAVFISSSSRDRVDHDVFISYSRRDSEFARQLLTRLKGENRDAWVDWQSIEAAEDFWRAIEIGIEAANTFVFILSPDSVASQYCQQEIDHAVKHNKRLIPVVCRTVDASTVHAALRPLNWIAFQAWNDDVAFAQLVRAIDTDLPYVRMHTRLQVKAIEWNKRGRDDSFLLRKMDLADAETWLAGSNGKEPTPTALQQEYITASRIFEDEYNQLLAEGEKARKRVRVAAIVVFCLVAIAAGAGVFAFFKTREAIVAVQNAKDSETRVKLADQSAIDANQKAKHADKNATNAEAKRKSADQQQKLAEEKLNGTKEKLTTTEAKRKDAELKANQAIQVQQQVQAKLEQQKAKLNKVSENLEQKKQNLRDVWQFSDAMAERSKGNNENALKILEAALKKRPQNTLAMMGQGYVYIAMTDYPKAERVFRQATHVDYDDPIAWFNLGFALQGQHKIYEAVVAYRKVIELDPENTLAYNNLGALLKDQNKFDEAIAAYHKAIKLDPEDTLAYYNLGNILLNKNKLKEAIAAYSRAIEIDATLGIVYAARGIAYIRQNRYSEAFKDLERAIELGYKEDWVLQLREQVRERLKAKG